MKTFFAVTSDVTHRHRDLWSTASLVALVFSLPASFVYGQTGNSEPGSIQVTDSIPMSFLEGKSFSGKLGLTGEPALNDDLLVFRDGMFISERCQQLCGYTVGQYWTRSTEGGVQVRAETPCLTSDAIIVWNGTVKGDAIEGTFTWTSKRWYWTIVKEFWFNGKLVESNLSATEKQDL